MLGARYPFSDADPDQLEEDHLDQLVGWGNLAFNRDPAGVARLEGLRLFDHLGPDPIVLEQTRVIESDGVTHLYHRVVRE